MKIRELNKSKSDPHRAPYVTHYDTDAHTHSCDCPGWTNQRPGQPRWCNHVRKLAAKHGGPDPKFTETPTRATTRATAPVTRVSRAAQAEVAAAVIPDVITTATTTARSLEPMLATAMTKGQTIEQFQTDQWVAEIKFDGHRQIVTVREGIVLEARSRAGNTRDLPTHIQRALALMPDGTYDAELIFPGGKSSDVTRGDVQDRLVLVLFDVLEVLGQNVMRRPYTQRRELLTIAAAHMGPTQAVVVSESFPVSRAAVETIWASGGEGAVVKRVTSIYAPGYRSADWIKVVQAATVTVTVIGFEPGDTGIAFGRTIVRDDDGHEFRVKTLDNRTIRMVAANPFAFVGKRLVIKYREKLASGAYRFPKFGEWDHVAGVGE